MNRISNFKKFVEMNEAKKKAEENNSRQVQVEDKNGMPNIPKSNNKDKKEKPQSTRYMRPEAQSETGVDYKKPEFPDEDNTEISEKNVEIYGRVAKLPKNTVASKGLKTMENLKLSKASVWYLMIEKNDDQLQMIKFNLNEGFDLNEFTNELKTYYIKKFAKIPKLVKLIENIVIDADTKYSWIKNIPQITVDGKKMISVITEDLIKILAK